MPIYIEVSEFLFTVFRIKKSIGCFISAGNCIWFIFPSPSFKSYIKKFPDSSISIAILKGSDPGRLISVNIILLVFNFSSNYSWKYTWSGSFDCIEYWAITRELEVINVTKNYFSLGILYTWWIWAPCFTPGLWSFLIYG